MRHALKRSWYAVVDRWRNVDFIRSTPTTLNDEQERLWKNYNLYRCTQIQQRNVRPDHSSITKGFRSNNAFYNAGFSVSEMMKGFFPDGDDIRTAFLLCLSYTGWNPAVLLSLDVRDQFLEDHPKDPERYILRGVKAKADDTEVTAEGLYKTEAGPAFIIDLLISKTAPLRRQLKRQLRGVHAQLAEATDVDAVFKLTERAAQLARGISSVWLYANPNHSEIQWLDDNNFVQAGRRNFLQRLIERLNLRQPVERRLVQMDATDFRDLYAENAYRASGGSILAVQRVLHHRRIRTSGIYVDNNMVRSENQIRFLKLTNGIWNEVEINGQIDPTVLAKISRTGEITSEERARLQDYRDLQKTRMGTRCTDPGNPPPHIDPTFKPGDGKLCGVQRCMLCLEHAIIVEESLDGLAMRCANLRKKRDTMSFSAFMASSFSIELKNTELALSLFDPKTVDQKLIEYAEVAATCGDFY
ncbi:hypothetical protein [Pseudorhodoferax sp. Leaf267]|uniref:hypothetical protein n=1 Tax=Pseudorhodoferax sp. Leaf267 TaxID=1736316 RepID=UPI0012E20C2D|nr:hypothetical protein [Pseudorhodoferax sp. Leaf267]